MRILVPPDSIRTDESISLLLPWPRKVLSKLQPSSLENAESLEQLRWLENGLKVKCVVTNFDSHCIDTPEDIEKVIRLMNIK